MALRKHLDRKTLVWLRGEVQSPPFSDEGRYEAGMLLRLLQEGVLLGMPHSRPLPSVGRRCHELRIRDSGHNWRIVYRLDPTAIFIANVFAKTGKVTQQREFDKAKERLKEYDRSQ